MSILDEIFTHKRLEVKATRRQIPLSDLEAAARELPPPLNFSAALKGTVGQPPRLIAEVKYRSPSRGILRSHLDPLELARAYAENGAAAISVLTDEKYFGGRLETLRDIAQLSLGLPILRKDFIFDDYQLLEARAAGASAVLLIVAMLDPIQLRDLLLASHELGLQALVETHTREEVDQALGAGAGVIGVNNRDLHSFTVSLDTCLQLCPFIPGEAILVAESGIRTAQDVARLAAVGVDAILVGEVLVTAPDLAAKMGELTLSQPSYRTLSIKQR